MELFYTDRIEHKKFKQNFIFYIASLFRHCLVAVDLLTSITASNRVHVMNFFIVTRNR